MRLGTLTNGRSCEYAMQEAMCKWLLDKKIMYKDEVRVPDVKRVADFIALKETEYPWPNSHRKPKKQLINIEAKCNNFRCMLDQLDDHSVYCDFSFAFILDCALTPMWFKEELSKKGYGLIIYNWDTESITEVFEAHFNKPKNKELRKHFIDEFVNGKPSSDDGLVGAGFS